MSNNLKRNMPDIMKNSKQEDHCEMLEKWLSLMQRELHCIGGWMRSKSLSSVAIYCGDVKIKHKRDILDTLLIREVLAANVVRIKYLITNTMTTMNNIPIINPNKITKDLDVDAIIVAQHHLMPNAKEMFKEMVNVKIISLKTIIRDIYDQEITRYDLMKKLTDLRNNGNKILVFATTIAEKIANKSKWEEYLVENKRLNGGIDLSEIDKLFTDSGLYMHYNINEYKKFLYEKKKGTKTLPYKNYRKRVDCQSYKYTVINGRRKTINAPDYADIKLRIYGDSTLVNYFSYDEETIASCLQEECNKHLKFPVEVIESSLKAATMKEMSAMINDDEIKQSDIIVIVRREGMISQSFVEAMRVNHIPFYSATPDFQRPHEMGEVFIDAHHPNWKGCKKYAELIFNLLFKSELYANYNIYKDFEPLYRDHPKPTPAIPVVEEWYDPIAQSMEFREYIESLKRERINTNEACLAGAIVMNCNPFTLGHRYLIEYASRKVDELYIFTVEEDRSVFPFNDRIALIREGVQDLSNVTVLPSGKYIISAITFPEYFEKGEKQEDTIDASQDVELFAEHIAPSLGITVRFAGEEPLDKVTLQYNKTMEEILPKYGIRFEVIPRKETAGSVISASRVRALLKEGKFDEIEMLVPKTTYDYLINRWGG